MAHIEPTATENEARIGYHSSVTQEIVNQLPMWWSGRRLRTSKYNQIVNYLAGTQIADLVSRNDDAFVGGVLALADANVPDILLKYQVPASVGLREDYVSRNLLVNGSFKLRTNPYLVADNWTYSGTIQYQTGLFNNTAVAMDPTAGLAYLRQELYLDIPAGKKLCASCYYRIPTWAAAGAVVPTGHGITFTVRYKDGTTSVGYAQFAAHTQGEWKRVQTYLTLTANIDLITFQVQTFTTAGFAINQQVVVDGCQVEQAQRASQWEPSRLDSPHYVGFSDSPPVDFEAEHLLYYTDALRDFWYRAEPTRTGVTYSRTNEIVSSATAGTETLTDYFGEDWDCTFSHSGNKVKKIGITCPDEEYGSYDLAFYNPRGFYETGYTYTIQALTWFADRIWLVINTRNIPENTMTAILCTVDPRVPSPEPDYLEVTAAISMPDVPLDIDRMEFRYEDQQHIYLGNATTEYRVRVYYDYYMVDTQTYMAYFREQYDQLVLPNENKG